MFFSQVGNGYLLGEVEASKMKITIMDYKNKTHSKILEWIFIYYFK